MPPPDASPGTSHPVDPTNPSHPSGASPPPGTATEDTLDLRLPGDFLARLGHPPGRPPSGAPLPTGPAGGVTAAGSDLLDGLADWGPVSTPAGDFRLVPVRVERDLALITYWMNDPAVAAVWGLAGPEAVTAAHLRARLDGDGRSVPCLGVLDGSPMSYVEVYRADLDPLARHYPARPHDTGIRLLIGGVADRGRGIGGVLLRATAGVVLDRRPRCGRVVGEPDLRNTPSIAAFLTAGFRLLAEIELPGRQAALMIRDRSIAHLL
ncbi:GNAT family N-acetyltransferase [Streptomyces sp. NPDC047928]|uniref:GNAT family N-acetyltransferase n=1 Tax=Streptomyces sp. NPDC047928 TaxID=3365492 RepID=UPI00370FDFBC